MGRALAWCGVFVAACVLASAGRSSSVVSLRADVAEWNVVPSVGLVSAGPVRITVRNLGSQTHELMVVRTDRFGDALRLRGDRAIARSLAAPIMVSPGGTRSFVIQLTPGSYVLLDNLPWHYWKGTFVAIAVR
jgi:uncharacterized cupredoxin-like copper-binding protein